MTNPHSPAIDRLPDEDRLELPAAWLEEVHPRRGAPSVRPATLDRPAPERAALDHKANRDAVAEMIESRDSDPALAAPTREHLEGRANPIGAAAVVGPCWAVGERSWHDDEAHFEFDGWALQHGLAFAVCAAVESVGTALFDVGTKRSVFRYRPRAWQLYLAEAEPTDVTWRSGAPNIREVIRAREVLAASTEAEYRAAVSALARHRGSEARRLAAAFIAPTESAWVTEACREYSGPFEYNSPDWVVCGMVGDRDQLDAAGLKAAVPFEFTTSLMSTLVEGLGAESLPFLTRTLEQSTNANERTLALEAIALLPSDAAMGYLMRNLVRQRTYQAAAQAVARFPVRALRTVAALAPSADAGQRLRLAALAGSDRAFEPALAGLDESDRDAVDGLFESSTPVMPAENLPELLVTPPWSVKRPKAKAVVIEGLEPPSDTTLVWAEGEQDRWAVLDGYYVAETSDEQWIHEARGYQRTKDIRRLGFFAFAPVEISRPVLEDWDGSYSYPTVWEAQRILARLGVDAVRPLLVLLSANTDLNEALVPIANLEAARLAADWIARLKTARGSGLAWLDRHGVEAARLLIPDAVGKVGKARRNAETALRHLADRRGAETVLSAAETYGAAALEAMKPLLEADPLAPIGGKVPKIGTWAVPNALPPVLLRDRVHMLPATAVEHLITVLSLATPDTPYPGVEIVAEHCDESSLAEFSLALFEHWIVSGAPSKDGWALTQLSHFGDDDTVRKLTPMIRAWPGESQHKRAVTGLGVLGAIGTEAALAAIHGISQKVKFKALKAEAADQIETIAAGLGLSGEQLADRLVPDFGLDDPSSLVLDYGPRRFTVGFDEQLRPFVTGADGKPRKALPKPGVRDDAEVAEASKQRFALLKKDLRTVAADQVKRLERAMIAGRTWTAAEFTEFFVDHALVWHLARRLVWLAEFDGVRTAFRVAEDRTLTDIDDEELKLPENAVIRLAHPILMSERESGAWAEILADYEILQPFQQLGRPVMAFTDEELKTGDLQRFEGVTVDYGRILGMTKYGWQRSAPQDGGCEPGIGFPLPSGGFVIVELDPGLVVGAVDWEPEQKLSRVRLTDVEDYGWYGPKATGLPDEIDPVTASEVLDQLTKLTTVD